jgi:solute carrier family 50 protein (sugar transporter)
VLGGALISGEHSVMVSVVGFSANVVLFLFYSAPLSVIASVIRTRCAKELLLPLSVLSTINGLCWTVYGAALGDLFIAVPNGVGCGLGIVQLVLIAVFGNGRQAAGSDKQGGGQNSSTGSTELDVIETSP